MGDREPRTVPGRGSPGPPFCAVARAALLLAGLLLGLAVPLPALATPADAGSERGRVVPMGAPERVALSHSGPSRPQEAEPVLWYFWRPDCPVCGQAEPWLDALGEAHPGLTIRKVEVGRDLAGRGLSQRGRRSPPAGRSWIWAPSEGWTWGGSPWPWPPS